VIKKFPSIKRRYHTQNLHFTCSLGLNSEKAEILVRAVFWAILKFRLKKIKLEFFKANFTDEQI
jgi:hypothetical protein